MTEGGALLFDLTVMSDLTEQPMPILKIPVERAARNNALWCDVVCQAHGAPDGRGPCNQ